MTNISHDELMKPIEEYWVQNGTSNSYELREEIKNWGGFWVPEHKCWAITAPCDSAKRVLKSIGLKLQFRRLV